MNRFVCTPQSQSARKFNNTQSESYAMLPFSFAFCAPLIERARLVVGSSAALVFRRFFQEGWQTAVLGSSIRFSWNLFASLDMLVTFAFLSV